MEKRTTQRIIGILVVAALIVILIPILFSGNTTQAPAQTADAKATSVAPDAITTAADASTIASADQASSNTVTAQPIADVQPAVPVPAVTPAPVIVALPQPEAPAAPKPVVATAPATATVVASATKVATSDVTITPTMSHSINTYNEQKVDSTAPIKTTSGIQVATTQQGQSKATATTLSVPAEGVPTAASANQEEAAPVVVEQPKPKRVKPVKLMHRTAHSINSGWVVQMGSFKVKSNATRLLAELKAEGFQAFAREIRSSTRVYVGPELKQASAESLASNIQQKMNMQGIVISSSRLSS